MDSSQTRTPEHGTAREGAATLHSPITQSNDRWGWLRGLVLRVKGFLAMPSPLAERAPGIDQLLDYARNAPWTARYDGPMRFAGVAFCWLVAIPAVVGLRIAEWPFTRPARLLFTVLTVKFLSEVPPVEWVTDNVIKPGADFALWLFL
jgi:hypothetical protein